MKDVLIMQGGWDGHEPALVAERFARLLRAEGFSVEVTDSQEVLSDKERLMHLALFVPVWTMGTIEHAKVVNIMDAVASGVGIGGCHGGMCDAFREDVDWQFMTGGQWVAHPGNDGVAYRVEIKRTSSPLVAGLSDFSVCSEHYYLHVDPVVEVLATTRFPVVDGPHAANGPVDMPVAWTKRWGRGRVFYSSLGHHDDVFEGYEAQELMRRGLLWAAAGKSEAN